MLKRFRRVTTRYGKLLARFMEFVKLAAIALWIRSFNRHDNPVQSKDAYTTIVPSDANR